jgi:hypothetical protein
MQMKWRMTLAGGLCVAIAPLALAQPFIGANFTASARNDSGFIPPDTMGAAGIDHFVELINGRYSVYRKRDGVRVQTSTLTSFFTSGGAPVINFAFDPRVLYDPYTRRWFACATDGPGTANNFLIAVSASSDPTAGWAAFNIDADADNSHTADFPMLGINGDSIVVSASMFPLSGAGLRNSIAVIPKADLVGGTPTISNAVTFQDNGQLDVIDTRYPATDMDNSTVPLPVMAALLPLSRIERSRAGLSAGVPAFFPTPSNYAVTAQSTAPTADQPGPNPNLHSSDLRFSSSPVVNNGEIWGVTSVNSGGRAAIRWFRLNAVTTAVLEQGTISDPQLHLMYPSIAVNDLGDVVVGFSATGPDAGQFASTYFAAGTVSGGTTSFGAITQTHAGAASYEALDTAMRNRWGDYSATTVDPADPSIFWTIQEFAAAPVAGVDQWADRVTEIILPQPGEARWKLVNGGSFGTASNWLGDTLPADTSHVIFSRSTASVPGGYTVNLLTGQTMDRLSVRQGAVTLSLVGQTITATNPSASQPSLTIGEFGGSPSVRMMGGTFSGTHAAIAPSSISAGGLVLSSAVLNLSGTLRMGSAGTLMIATGAPSVVRAASLELAAGARINLADSDMLVDYASLDPSPISTIHAMIQQGYNNGFWNGTGIRSGSAATSPNAGEDGRTALGFAEASNVGITSFNGFTIDSTAVLIKYTYAGDADLNGQVDVADLGRLASSWQSAGLWVSGDFDYSGFVDVADLGLLASNWQAGVGSPLGPVGPGGFMEVLRSFGLPGVAVPEPCVLSAMGWILALRRKRAGRQCTEA